MGEFYITKYTKFKLRRFESFAVLSHVGCEMVRQSNCELLRPELKALCCSAISVTV